MNAAGSGCPHPLVLLDSELSFPNKDTSIEEGAMSWLGMCDCSRVSFCLGVAGKRQTRWRDREVDRPTPVFRSNLQHPAGYFGHQFPIVFTRGELTLKEHLESAARSHSGGPVNVSRDRTREQERLGNHRPRQTLLDELRRIESLNFGEEFRPLRRCPGTPQIRQCQCCARDRVLASGLFIQNNDAFGHIVQRLILLNRVPVYDRVNSRPLTVV